MNTLQFRLMTILLVMGVFVGIGVLNAEAQDYFPLQVGNRWVYTPSYGDGNRIDTIIGTEDVNGTFTYIWKREESALDNYHEKAWLAKDGSDLKNYKFWGNMGADPAVSMNQPVLWYKLNPVVGDSWVSEADFGNIHFKRTLYVESINETVTVPAGTFNNCIRIRILEEFTKGGITEYEYKKHWLAPDIGPVMYSGYTLNWASVDFSQQLVSFSNIGPMHIDINANQDEYGVGDTLRAYGSIYNVGNCEMADIYAAVQLTDGTLLFYPDYSTIAHPALPYPVNICGSPFISDYLLLEYTIPITLPKGTYTWYAVLTPPGTDPYNPGNWLSFDQAPLNVN
ncbi:MAG: hypothetical protein HZC48_02285 [Nitrospirae bacterium]|nr:hypothetical protein [Nitrospirota bacterium]